MALSDELHRRASTAQPWTALPLPAGLREAAREVSGKWWHWLVAGIAWIAVALVILRFDAASVSTVGILLGMLFALAAAQNALLTAIPGPTRWGAALFGALFLVSAVICLADPVRTFAALAEMVGFLFAVVAVWWMVEAFLERPVNPLWWMGLVSGILMAGLAFWSAGRFFIHRAYLLLVFAGLWALMQGITHIARAFAVRRLHDGL
jgi:uncharacterized membrane protein HdeD (DUF308 family)